MWSDRQKSVQKARHLGVGDADTTPAEWMVHVRQDTWAALASRGPILTGLSIAHGLSQRQTRAMYIDKMAAEGIVEPEPQPELELESGSRLVRDGPSHDADTSQSAQITF